MGLIKLYNHKTGTTYVYENINEWVEEKGKFRSRRKLIGKLDKETGKLVPTAKRGRPRKSEEPDLRALFSFNRDASDADIEKFRELCERNDQAIDSDDKVIADLEDEQQKIIELYEATIEMMEKELERFKEILGDDFVDPDKK